MNTFFIGIFQVLLALLCVQFKLFFLRNSIDQSRTSAKKTNHTLVNTNRKKFFNSYIVRIEKAVCYTALNTHIFPFYLSNQTLERDCQ